MTNRLSVALALVVCGGMALAASVGERKLFNNQMVFFTFRLAPPYSVPGLVLNFGLTGTNSLIQGGQYADNTTAGTIGMAANVSGVYSVVTDPSLSSTSYSWSISNSAQGQPLIRFYEWRG